MDEAIHQPHDKLFKATFSDRETAAGFLQWQLPPALSAAIDWDSLVAEPGSFIDSQMRQSESDLLFSARIGDTTFHLYLLFEHLSSPDSYLALKLLRYMVRIWETLLAPCGKGAGTEAMKLPVILPLVVAQNADRWKMATQFSDLLSIPQRLEDSLRPYIPDFAFTLLQLADSAYHEMQGTPAGILILRLMKAERLHDLLADPVWDESLMMQIPREVFELMLRYMLHGEIDRAGFAANVRKLSQPRLQTTAMSLAEQLIEEGRQEGRQEGRRQDILRLLAVRFGRVPDGMRGAVLSESEMAELDRLFDAAITVADLEAFAEGL